MAYTSVVSKPSEQPPQMRTDMQDPVMQPHIPPLQPAVIMQPTEQFSWHMFRSAVAGIICWFVFGVSGMAYAILAYVDYGNGKGDRYLAKKRCALGWSIASIVCGSIAYSTVVIYYIVGAVNVANYYSGGH